MSDGTNIFDGLRRVKADVTIIMIWDK